MHRAMQLTGTNFRTFSTRAKLKMSSEVEICSCNCRRDVQETVVM